MNTIAEAALDLVVLGFLLLVSAGVGTIRASKQCHADHAPTTHEAAHR